MTREYNFFNPKNEHVKFFADSASAQEILAGLLRRNSNHTTAGGWCRIYFVRGTTLSQWEGESHTVDAYDWVEKEVRD